MKIETECKGEDVFKSKLEYYADSKINIVNLNIKAWGCDEIEAKQELIKEAKIIIKKLQVLIIETE